MISEVIPADWQTLEESTADLLTKAGLAVEHGLTVSLARGQSAVDVVGVETVTGRKHTIFCECKRWQANVPQEVVHAFRTVVADGGANVGYIISSSGFQRGAYEAAKNTNVRLTTWDEFQSEFEPAYYERYFRRALRDRVDSLVSFTEPLTPAVFLVTGRLPEPHIPSFLALKEQYHDLAMLCLTQFLGIRPLGVDPLSLPLDADGSVTAGLKYSC